MTGTVQRNQSEDPPSREEPVATLIRVHILNLPIDAKIKNVAHTTWDIICRYGSLAPEVAEMLFEDMDDPSNGIAMQNDAGEDFALFELCLEPTTV